MTTPIDARLIEEARVHRLRFACDDCAFFLDSPAPRCGHGYPLGERADRVLRVGESLVFCKEFEG
ncbi:MAG: hypothetical protein ACHREM_29465 [Polyangiales bacterium]